MTARVLPLAAALLACVAPTDPEPTTWHDPTAATLAPELDAGDGDHDADPEPTLLDIPDKHGDPSNGPGVCQSADDPARMEWMASPSLCFEPDIWLCFEGEFRPQPVATLCCSMGPPAECHMLAPAQACPMGEVAVCEV